MADRPDCPPSVYLRGKETLNTFAERFEYMLQECKIDRAKLARALSGAGQQKITNWLERGRIGGPSRKEISGLTGVSTDWLNDQVGSPFPHGPVTPNFVKEISGGYAPRTHVALTPRELALVENYRASSERFRRAVDEQVAASAESAVTKDAG